MHDIAGPQFTVNNSVNSWYKRHPAAIILKRKELRVYVYFGVLLRDRFVITTHR